MLNNSVSRSLKFHQLPDDTCRLLATWIISHLDKNGVFYGQAISVRSVVLPHRDDVSVDRIELYLQAMETAGLIQRFTAAGLLWQWWPGFVGEQVGLRQDRETTNYPPPPGTTPPPGGNDAGKNPATRRKKSGKNPRPLRRKVKVKVNINNNNNNGPPIFQNSPQDRLATYYQQQTGNAPAGVTASQMWTDDCVTILDYAGGDEARARALIDEAVTILDGLEYSHKQPGSLLGTIEQQLKKRNKRGKRDDKPNQTIDQQPYFDIATGEYVWPDGRRTATVPG